MRKTVQSLGDAPIEPRYASQMNALGHALDTALNKGKLPARDTGFVLLVFPLHDHEGRCNYISNGQREDVIVLLREQLARFEGMPDAKGRA